MVSASAWHSTQSSRLCAPALNSASMTAMERPSASAFISGSSWHLKHFSFGMVGTSAAGAAAASAVAAVSWAEAGASPARSSSAERPRTGATRRRSRVRNMRWAPLDGRRAMGPRPACTRRVPRGRHACEFDPRCPVGGCTCLPKPVTAIRRAGWRRACEPPLQRSLRRAAASVAGRSVVPRPRRVAPARAARSPAPVPRRRTGPPRTRSFRPGSPAPCRHLSRAGRSPRGR